MIIKVPPSLSQACGMCSAGTDAILPAATACAHHTLFLITLPYIAHCLGACTPTPVPYWPCRAMKMYSCLCNYRYNRLYNCAAECTSN